MLALAERTRLSVAEMISRLNGAGLNSLDGEDAEIFDDGVQSESSGLSYRTAEWVEVHRTAHRLGMQSTASMRFGGGEGVEQRVQHLETLRALQEETRGFAAFTLRTVRAAKMPDGRSLEEVTSVEYLKTMAVSRMLLDNIANVQSSWATQGLKVLQMGLRFGSNDAGTVHASEGSGSRGSMKKMTEEELRRVIRDAGFFPVQRDAMYRTMFLQ